MNKKGKIIIGKSGSGKSYYILSKLINNKKKNLIININTIANINYYLTNFQYLQDYDTYNKYTLPLYASQFPDKVWINPRNTNMIPDKKIFNIINWEVNQKFLINQRIVFLDCTWNMLSTTEKMRYLWNYSHSDAEIVIELQDLDELLNMKLDNYMIRDIKKYWNIIQCEHNNNRYKRKYK